MIEQKADDREPVEVTPPGDNAESGRVPDEATPVPDTLADALETEGAVEAASSSGPSAITAWLFREGADLAQVDADEVAELTADDALFVWLDLDGFDPSELQAVATQLDLPEAGVRLALSGWKRPRLDVFADCYMVTVTVPYVQAEAHRFLASELVLFVGRNYLASAHQRPLPFIESTLTRAAQNPALLALDSAFLLSILIDELLAYYEQLTEGLEDEVEALEERALTDASDEFLEDLLRLKRFVFAAYRLTAQHRPLLEAFLRPDFPLVGNEAIEPHLRDLEERLDRLLDALGSTRDDVNGTFDLYVSRVAHQTNGIMKVLTIVSATLLPATVILSFFGTSFTEPPVTSEAGFVVMLVLIVLTTGGALVLFQRWGWLGEQRSRSSR